MVKEVKTKLSPPWVETLSKLKAMFGEDPDINIKYDSKYEVKLYVNDAEKATALYMLLKDIYYYGNISFSVEVIPPNYEFNEFKANNPSLVYEKAFKNNPVLSFVHKVDSIFGFNATYVVFKNKVVQYFNDNLNDVYGNTSTLYEDIARDIIDENASVNLGVFFCTDVVEHNLRKTDWL